MEVKLKTFIVKDCSADKSKESVMALDRYRGAIRGNLDFAKSPRNGKLPEEWQIAIPESPRNGLKISS